MFGRRPRFKQDLTDADYNRLGREVEAALVKDYIGLLHSTRRQIWRSFARGFFAGIGGVVGATIGVAVLIYILSKLQNIPGLHDVVNNIANTIKQHNR